MAERLERVTWLADVLSCSLSDVYYLISVDRIPGVVRLGPRMIRVDPDAVHEWISAGGFVARQPAEVGR
jgi:predicted DNA-binding transcriptional regulator AlpA